MKERIVLAYSGGLDTSVAIPWLTERYGAEVIAVTLDLGQGRELEQIRERALATGASRCHVLDVREEFARDYILPALQAAAQHLRVEAHHALQVHDPEDDVVNVANMDHDAG